MTPNASLKPSDYSCELRANSAFSKDMKQTLNCPFEKRYPSQLVKDHTFFMQLAYNQAIDAFKQNEVPVGAIIVKDGEVIAASHNQVESTNDPTAHAEILAITQAARHIQDWRLNACTLYVTKEPCPMCTGAAIMARIEHVVYAFQDPKMGCMGGACSTHEIPTLNHHLSVTRGVFDAECKALLQAFFALKRL